MQVSLFLKVRKSQKQFFLASIIPKSKQNVLGIPVLASEMGQINKIKALYYIKYPLISRKICLYLFELTQAI
jgi:hypothetical protein